MVLDPVKRFREVVGIWNTGDLGAFAQTLAEDVEFTPDPRWPEAGPFVGREAVMGFMRDFRAPWEQVDLEIVGDVELRAGIVVAPSRWVTRGAASGADVPVEFTMLARVTPAGEAEMIRGFFDHDEALAWVDAQARAS